MIRWQKERELVLETSRELVEKGLVIGKAGNVSLRLPAEGGFASGGLAITPTSRYYESLSVEDIPVVDFDGRLVEGNLPPSSELPLHTGIYAARRGINAVIHSHSTYASAIAVAGLGVPAILEEEVAFLGGEIQIATYAPSGSRELAANAVAALGERNAVILANHGAVGVGRTMREALTVCELLEQTARIYLLALAIGKVNPLPAEAVTATTTLFRLLQSGEDL